MHWFIVYSSSLPDGVAGDWKPSESDSSGGGVGSLAAAGFSAGLSADGLAGVAAADSAGKFGLAAATVSGLVLVLSAAGAADFLATAGGMWFKEAAASSSLSSSSSSSDEISGCFLAALAGG